MRIGLWRDACRVRFIIPQVMKLATLADVRALMQHLPDGHRERSTWRYVEAQVAHFRRGQPKALDPKRPIREADIAQHGGNVRFGPILLQKDFWSRSEE